MVGRNKPTQKIQTQVGHKKENIKVNPGGVGGGNSTLLSPKRLAKFFQNESSTKKGEYLMIHENMVETTTQLEMDQPFYLATSWFQILHKNPWQTNR